MNWFLSSEIPNSDPAKALFHICPVPFEESVSYGPGTAQGPESIIDASAQLELADPLLIRHADPTVQGIHTGRLVEKKDNETTGNFLGRLESLYAGILGNGSIPVQVGGEHTITFPVVKAYSNMYDDFGVIQFDAHADLRKTYEGTRFSHACVMRRVVDELHIPIMGIGYRAISREESVFIQKREIPIVTGQAAYSQNLEKIQVPDSFPGNVFITFDVDCLDPSIMPATGTPVPGGLQWYQTLSLLESIARQRRIVGFDIVEFSPIPHLHFCEFTISQILYYLLALVSP